MQGMYYPYICILVTRHRVCSEHCAFSSCECISFGVLCPGDDELSGGVIAAIVAVPLLFLIVCVVVVIAVLLVWKRHGGSGK